MAESDVLSPRHGDPDPVVKIRPPPLTAFPVQEKPGWYVIGGELVGPETVFSYAKSRLKGNPYLKAKAYVLAESKRIRGALVCELGDHYVTEHTGEVHHRIRRDVHVAKALGLACHNHNAAHGDPEARSARTSETVRERKEGMDILSESDKEQAPTVVKLNIDLYPVFCRYLEDEIAANHKLAVKDAISGGAKFMRKQTGHGSPQSARNYLDMETSKEGKYDIIEGYVVLREVKIAAEAPSQVMKE
jgi:hypothetical protein